MSGYSQKTQLKACAALSALMMGALASPVWAADAAPDAKEVAEVVVTVQKRAQRTLEVPIALTSMSQTQLKELGVTDFNRLSLFVPGFYVQDQSPNNSGYVIRGMTSDSGEATADTRVSVFQDGVSISRSRGSYVELFDVERVEVAKGPQSTLFGRGALIGAVNIIQAKANVAAPDYMFMAGAGDYNRRTFEGMVNQPIADSLAVRVSGRYKARDGYVKDVNGGKPFNSQEVMALRGVVTYRPTDTIRNDFIYNYQYDNTTGTSFKNKVFLPSDPNTGQVLGDFSSGSGAALSSRPDFIAGSELGLKRRIYGATNLFEWRLTPELKLSSISGYRRFKSVEVFDPDGFALPMLVIAEDARSRQYSQEFRVNYDAGGAFSGFAGVSYFDEIGTQTVPMTADERVLAAFQGKLIKGPVAPSMPMLLAALGPMGKVLKANHTEIYANRGKTQSWDVYADGTYRFSPQFEVTAGLRYTSDDRTSGYSARLLNGGSVLAASAAKLPIGTPVGILVQPTANNGDMISKTYSDDSLTYRLVLRYMPVKTLSLYASYARGRQPLSYSTESPKLPFADPVFTRLDAEVADSYELGAKSRLMDGRLTLEGAIYQYDYSNFRTPTLNASGQIVQANVGSTKPYGAEVQASFNATEWASFSGSYTYTHSRISPAPYKNIQTRLTPEHRVSLAAFFKANTQFGVVSFTPTYVYQSKMSFETSFPELTQKAYGLLDLRAGLQPHDMPWRVDVFVKNATDTKYDKDQGNTGARLGLPTFIAGEPRMFGVEFTYRR